MSTFASLLVPPGYLMSSEEDKPSTSTARIDDELLRLARIVVAHRPGRSGKALKLVDYLDSILRPAITRDHEAIMKEIAEAQGCNTKKSGK